MAKNYFKYLVCTTLFLGSGLLATSLSAQEMTRAERLRILEQLRMEDEKVEVTMQGTLAPKTTTNWEKLELPPLSVFLDAVVENATVKKIQSQVDQAKNEHRLQKRDWWNLIRINGNYSYGRYNIMSNASDEYTPMYQTTMASAQHNFNVGAGIAIPFGEFTNRKLKLKRYKYDVEQLQYEKEEVMEERRLKILEAYNQVTVQLATIRAKAETAALYNAQMKISENNFIQGKMDIAELSMERSRRTSAVVTYEEARVLLHNSIMLLEMLTNIKIIQD